MPRTHTAPPPRRGASGASAGGASARGPVYRGRFGPEQAERLLWRAGLRPASRRGGEAGEEGRSTARSSRSRGRGRSGSPGRPPKDEDGRPLAPATPGATTTCGGSTAWCAPNRPLIERMTLVWHDWFATSNDGVGSQRLMLHQNEMLPQARARLLPRPARAGHARPGDAAVAVGLGEHARSRRTRTTRAS